MLASKADSVQLPSTDKQSAVPEDVWHQLVGPYQGFLEAVSQRLTDQVETFEPEIKEPAHYVMANPGKRLRPLLVALSGGAQEGFDDELVEVAVIIEMIHLATLVHDDILDAAELRRNRPTLAARLGNDVTVLLGDCLFAHALKLAAQFPTPQVCADVAEATKRVCSGEILQTLRHDAPLSRSDYYRIIEMKTAELFRLSCRLGARYGRGTREIEPAVSDYGLALGTAYQIYDDCLDIFGTEASTGKSLGTDLIKEKLTLPVLVLLESVTADEKNEIISKLNRWDRCHTNWLMTLLHRHQVLEKSRSVIDSVLGDSRSCLAAIDRSDSASPLYKLSEFLELKVEEMAPKVNTLGISP